MNTKEKLCECLRNRSQESGPVPCLYCLRYRTDPVKYVLTRLGAPGNRAFMYGPYEIRRDTWRHGWQVFFRGECIHEHVYKDLCEVMDAVDTGALR